LPFPDFLGSIASVLTGAPNDAHRRIWGELSPWLSSLMVHAAPKWLPTLAVGVTCETGPPPAACPRTAIAACDVCHRPCCLSHSRIDQNGDAICLHCVFVAIQAQRSSNAANGVPPRGRSRWHSPPPGAGEADAAAKAAAAAAVEGAFKVLGVRPGVPFATVKSAYRKLAAKLHPDKYPSASEAEKQKLADRLKIVNGAFETLKKHYGET
jgi:hypothetical protein